jgi:hypothetical protein
VPWSTRAVILLAFAIQLMPVSERLGHHSLRPADRLVLTDGRLVALWLADRAAEQAASGAEPVIAARFSAAGTRSVPAELAVRPQDLGAWRKCGLMPIPPPATA